MAYFEKRKYERKLVRIKVIYSCGNIFYSGNVSNISKEGMLVETVHCLPVEAALVLMIKNNESFLNLGFKVKRLVRNNGMYKGMGLQLVNSQAHYAEFVESQEPAYKN